MVSNIKKLAYSCGAIATALSYQSFSAYIIYFYADVVRLSAELISLGMLIWGVWNAINDPLLGYLSDRTRTRWGRRIPYILFTAAPFGLIYFLVWSPPFDVNQTLALFLYFLIFICLFDLCYTLTVLNWASLFPEMFKSLKERAEVNSYRQALGMVGLILGIALPPLIFSTFGWSLMGALFGSLIALSYFISIWGSSENTTAEALKQPGIIPAFRHTLFNRSFLTFVVSNLFIQFSFTMVLAMVPFYAKYILKVEEGKIALILVAALLVAIAGMFAWRKVTVKLGAKRAYLIAIGLFAAALFPFALISRFPFAVAAASLVGIGFSGVILISDVLISDIIDEDESSTHARREGIYFGTNAFICRFSIALEAISIGLIFTRTGYNPYVFTQTKEFLLGLRWLISGLPILALLLAFLIMWFYPLDEARLQWIKERIRS